MTDIHHSTRTLCLNSEHDFDVICVLDGAGSVFQVNFFAPIMLVNGLLGELKAAVPSGGGSIVNITSIACRVTHAPVRWPGLRPVPLAGSTLDVCLRQACLRLWCCS